MSLAPQLKDLLVCPLCKGKVEIREDDQKSGVVLMVWRFLFETVFRSCSPMRPGP